MPWDAFMSHASEDKESFVRPLAHALQAKRLSVWYDEITIPVGASLRESIDRGLAECDYGIVVLSPHFFAKKWPQRELDGLVARETLTRKIVLPIWLNVQGDQVAMQSPTLADRKAILANQGVNHVVNELLRVIKPSLADNPAFSDTHDSVSGRGWDAPLAPLTLANLISYAQTKNGGVDWRLYSPAHYSQLRRLSVNTIPQLHEAIEDTEARRILTDTYQRLLGRAPDWTGIFAYQPFIYLEGFRGQALVEQEILASDEYRLRRLQNKATPAE